MPEAWGPTPSSFLELIVYLNSLLQWPKDDGLAAESSFHRRVRHLLVLETRPSLVNISNHAQVRLNFNSTLKMIVLVVPVVLYITLKPLFFPLALVLLP
jgi:hypothetical protein